MIEAPERCIKLLALTVVRKLRFHSSLQKVVQFTAKLVLRIIDHQEGINILN
jgi:hypothetical protein